MNHQSDKQIKDEIRKLKPKNMTDWDYAVQLSKEKIYATDNGMAYKYTWKHIYDALNMCQYNMTENTIRKNMRKLVKSNPVQDTPKEEQDTELDRKQVLQFFDKKQIKKQQQLDKQEEKIKIEKYQKSMSESPLRRNLRQLAQIQNEKQQLQEYMVEHSGVDKYVVQQEDLIQPVSDSTDVLMLSDFHFGMKSDVTRNKFNKDIFKQRMVELTQKVIVDLKKNKPKRLIIALLGDLIHGDIHLSARTFDSCDVQGGVQQSNLVVEPLFNMLSNLAPYCEKMVICSVCGNHDRTQADLKSATPQDTYYPTYFLNMQRFAKNYNDKNNNRKIICVDSHGQDITDISTDDFYNLKNEFDKCVFPVESGLTLGFCHGHYDKENKVVTNFLAIAGQNGPTPGAIFMGHTHNVSEKTVGSTHVFVNGSMCGADIYANSLRGYSQPAQTLVHFENGNANDFTKHVIALNTGYEQTYKTYTPC